MTRTCLVIVLCTGTLVPLVAQTEKPGFEVASVRRNVSGEAPYRVTLDFQPGRFVATNVFLRWLIAAAYAEEGRVPILERIVGGPAWVDTDPFDVQAVTDGSTPQATMQLMLQQLLEERFGLRMRTEQRNEPAYALLPDRPDGRLGPQLTPAETKECSDISLELARARRCGWGVYFDKAAQLTVSYGSNADMRGLIEHLAGPAVARLDRPVVDRTGIAGRFDFEVRFSVLAGRVSASPAAAAPQGPSLFTALREQLGLKLEPVTAPIEVLVIDEVHQPTEN
jgi:uncharacterized protein (TIGR03435 family)